MQISVFCQKKLIWCHSSSPPRIELSNLDGSDRFQIDLNEDLNIPVGIFIDQENHKIYWTDRKAKTINRIDLDGNNKEVLYEVDGTPEGLSVNLATMQIYFANTDKQSIQRYNILSGEIETIVGSSPGGAYPRGIKLDLSAKKIYWTDSSLDMIRRVNFDGTNVEDIIVFGYDTALEDLVLDLRNDKIYWTEPLTNKIQRANLDGTQVEDIILDVLESPSGIAIDENTNKIYWTDRGIDKIQKANLDGTQIEDVIIEDLNYPHFMMIYGFENPKECSLALFPNPVINLIQIKSGCTNYDAIIHDALGRQLYQKFQLYEEFEIEVSNYPTGVYFITISKSNFKLTKKFIKI